MIFSPHAIMMIIYNPLRELKKCFDMTDLGLLHYYLGIEVIQNPKFIFYFSKKNIGELLCKFGMKDCNFVSTPMEQNLKISSNEGNIFEDPTKYRKLVGSLIYLFTTHPDITFAIGILSRFMHKPCEGHWIAAQRVLKYLKGTQTLGIKYSKVLDFHLTSYSNSAFDGDREWFIYFKLFDDSRMNCYYLEIKKTNNSC